MKRFYQGIEQKKEIEHWQDTQNRKHHDTLLPGQKSPIPLDRYDDFGTKQIDTPNSTLSKNVQYKYIARALYNFQVSCFDISCPQIYQIKYKVCSFLGQLKCYLIVFEGTKPS